jgi:hypothetical protein
MRMQLLIAIVTVSALSAQARLGETKAQLDRRFPRMFQQSGTSTNQLAGESVEIYNFKDWHLIVVSPAFAAKFQADWQGIQKSGH